MKTTFINSTVAEYTDSELSWLQSDVLESGYFAGQDGTKKFQIVQKAVPALGFDITAGKILLPFSKSSIDWKIIIESNTLQSFTITPNVSGANRVDAVIVKSSTATEPDALKTNISSVQVIQGSGTSPLSDGAIQTAIGAGYVFTRLGNITVPTGATTILDSNITNVLPKVKISKAVNIDSQSVVSDAGGSTINTVISNSNTNIDALKPVSLIKYSTYTTDTTSNYFELGATVTGSYPTDMINNRAGVYTLRGKDFLFGLESNQIFFVTKTAGASGAWSAKTNIGVAVYNNKWGNFTIGCDEANNKFHLVYNKNSGSNDGKLYYRMLTVNSDATITVGSEVVAWEDVTWKYTTVSSQAKGLDSEFVKGTFYVIFKNDDGAGNYKPTMIANTASDGTWVSKLGFPADVDASFAHSFHGRGCAIAYVGANRIGMIWYNRTVVTPSFPSYASGGCGYREYNVVTGSWSAKESFQGFTDSGSYNDFMTFGNSSIAFLDKRVIVAVQLYDSSISGNQPFAIYRRDATSVWTQLTSIGFAGESYSGSVILGGIATQGRKVLFGGTFMYSGGSSGTASGLSIKDLTDGYGQRNIVRQHGTATPNNYNMMTFMRAVQDGVGNINSIGAIFKTGSQGLSMWYTKKVYNSSPFLQETVFTNPDSLAQMIGVTTNSITAGGSGESIIFGNLTTDFDVVLNRKYYIGSAGITPYQQANGLYLGLGIGTRTIRVDIDTSENLSSTVASNLVYTNIDYDGMVKYTVNDGATERDVFKHVYAGDTFTLPANSGNFTTPTFLRTQK